MGHLYNESIRPEIDASGRLTGYEWRGARYTVHAVLKAYGTADPGRVPRLVRVRVSAGTDAVLAVAELAHHDGRWRLRHHFGA